MRGKLTLLAGVCAGAIAFPAYAQTAPADAPVDSNEIVVTAQRTNQKLQDVPIAVSAFNTEALEKQQIKNTSDLQLTLPNVTFTKTNFTSSSFTIRGIGDLCVGITCDSATGIHINDAPQFGSRLFEGEFYDMAQIEVLRGPQGTLFGRNATSGVVNFRTARPKLGQLEASVEGEYGNYNGVKSKGMINVPLGDIAAVRIAGFYLNRDGYTKNLFNNTKIDDRNMYGVRGSIRIEPSSGTTIDLMAQYFHEKDNRMRIQKQMCQRDPTGVLGCLAAERRFEMTNANSTAGATLNSKQFYGLFGVPGNIYLSDLSTTSSADAYAGVTNPADFRTVNTDTTPQYYTSELVLQGSIDQELGSGMSLKVSGNYQDVKLESQQDYNNSVQNRAVYTTGLTNLFNLAHSASPVAPYFLPISNALEPNGPNGPLCTSLPTENLSGIYGSPSQGICTSTPLDFDRSNDYHTNWTAEAILSSKWDGKFNFLVGGIYGKVHDTESSYYVDSFTLDYATGVLGAWNAAASGIAPTATTSYYFASPFFRSNTSDFKLTTYGLFGEAYLKFNDKLKLTGGLRYNHDEKTVVARTTLLSFLAPTGTLDATASPYIGTPSLFLGTYDADPGRAGAQLFQTRTVAFHALTGRAVLDYQITRNNLLYVSYSRGYKSGGINPPLSVGTTVESFAPEFVNAYEIGSKNTFADGKVTFNLTGFMYDYKGLQLSRIVNRTSQNANVDAKIYGLEAEAILRPIPELTINMNASYLHTKVTNVLVPMSDSRDYGGGRADAVIIKDLTTAANCAIGSNAGSATAVNTFVGAVNGGLGLAAPQSFGAGSGIASTGAYGICSALAGQIANPSAGLRTLFSTPTGALPFTYYANGVPKSIIGNKLPGAPDYKFSAGMQYAAPLGGDMTLTPRVDYIYTGKSFGNIFNGHVNEVPAFSQINAQIELDGPDKKWFVRGWVQNLTNNTAITGLYVTDQSSGLYTNVFTLEPRRYGLTAGLKF